jgi:KAP family P-loop domain
MSSLPDTVDNLDLLRWVFINSDKPFDPNMLINATHTTDWQWQAVVGQMEALKRQGYVNKLKQDPAGSTYWTVTQKGESYLRALEQAGRSIDKALAPVLSKAFGATRIEVGRTTSLTFEITNPNPSAQLTNIGFTDSMPGGLVVASPNGLIAPQGNGVVLASPGATTVSLTGASLTGRGSYSFIVNVTGKDVGTKNNTTMQISAAESGLGNTASASLDVTFPPDWRDLSELLALQLKVTTEGGSHLAMASLIAPSLAVTPFSTVSGARILPEHGIEVTSPMTGIKTAALPVAVDAENDLAVLKLDIPIPVVLPSDLIPSDDSFPYDTWSSYISLPGRQDRLVTGRVAEATTVEGRPSKLLRLSSPVGQTGALAGAPVVWGDHLIAIVSGVYDNKGFALYATPITRRKLAPLLPPDQRQIAELGSKSPEASAKLAGYKSDNPEGDDLIGIERDVEALASLVAAKEVEPPLSLGLFGDWGTGKSFFMNAMKKRIRELTTDAKAAGGESLYCTDVVQLTFNAWNYIDSDLWASLAAEIFEGLAAGLAERRADGDSKSARAIALAAASSSAQGVEEAEREKDAAERELGEIEKEISALEKKEAEITNRLRPMELLKQLRQLASAAEDVRDPIIKAANELHIPDAEHKVEQLGQELLGLRSNYQAIWLILRTSPKLAILCLLGITAAIGVPFLLKHLDIGGVILRIITAAGFLSATLGPFLNWSHQGLKFIKQAQDAQNTVVQQNREAKTAELRERRDNVRKTIESTQKRADEAAKNAAALTQQLEAMRADRKMVDFIRQRYQSTDYRDRLGVIAKVRADFKHLSVLLRDLQADADEDLKEVKRRQESLDKDRKLFPRIDRIVLYIDDLDRCQEKIVFEVLQAVHLLLAFPLFVVIVGVDPRWLLHSLRKHAGAFELGEEDNSLMTEESGWRSTPLNYLEKIFQIPFTLLPIRKTGFEKFVDAFASSSRDTALIGSTPDTLGPVEEPKSAIQAVGTVGHPESAAASEAQGQEPMSVTPGPRADSAAAAIEQPSPMEPIDRYPKHLRIEPWERVFMKSLYEFIGTPRAAKRFINIYRLLRASVAPSEQSAFVGDERVGEYRSALFLLALLTGYPREATVILRAVIENKEQFAKWGQFRRSLEEQVGKPLDRGTDGEKLPSENGHLNAPSQAYRQLLEKLGNMQGLLDDLPYASINKWAPRVARYSFESGRLLFVNETN